MNTMAIAIKKVLEKECPAFYFDNGCGGSTWHHCFCLAEARNDSRVHCVCVWHLTDTCIVGTWPQLAFISAKLEVTKKEANIYLEKAKAALAQAQPSKQSVEQNSD